jgi:hypothetical protein
MDSQHSLTPLPPKTSTEEGGQNINKIRDILFGADMRKNDSRLDSLEARFNKESEHLRADMEQRMDSIEMLIKSEFETLVDKLQFEKTDHEKNLLILDGALKTANTLLNQRIGALESRSLDEIRKLRHQEHDDIKNLRQNLQKLREETEAFLEKELDILRKTKIDKASIASLFSNDAV